MKIQNENYKKNRLKRLVSVSAIVIVVLVVVLLMFQPWDCFVSENKLITETTKPVIEPSEEPMPEPTPVITPQPTLSPTSEPTPQPTLPPTPKPTPQPTPEPISQPDPTLTPAPVVSNTIPQNTIAVNRERPLVVIDAGHQGRGNNEKEPIGPGASVTKPKVSSGTKGCVTGIPEYELTLTVSLKLRDLLVARGYEVIMIRESHDVNISNSERAQIANQASADVFLRIHADGVDNSSVHGATTMCQSSSNPYNGSLYSQSRHLSECVLNGMVNAMNCKRRSVQENDNMSGINWCQVPVSIVEMGFMSNPDEDRLMATEEYQNRIAEGIANGVDAYFGR